jgi:hypothetical protein
LICCVWKRYRTIANTHPKGCRYGNRS